MNLLIAIAAIAALCGPRVQSNATGTVAAQRAEAKECQVQLIKCVKAKTTPLDESLVTCMQEVK